jgi:hypothetical protein
MVFYRNIIYLNHHIQMKNKESYGCKVIMKANVSLGLVLILIGVIMVAFSFYEAYVAYQNYKPVVPAGGSNLAEAVSNASFELINLAARLAFVGIMVWAGSVILKYGVSLIQGPPVKVEKK